MSRDGSRTGAGNAVAKGPTRVLTQEEWDRQSVEQSLDARLARRKKRIAEEQRKPPVPPPLRTFRKRW